jgi:tetratricopeptide (TPR) repeat protein
VLVVALPSAIVGTIRNAMFENHLNSGVMMVQKKEYDQGRRSLEQAVLDRPHSAEAHLLLGASYYVEILERKSLEEKPDQLEAMARQMQRALRLQPHMAQAEFYLGLYEYEQGNAGEAMARMRNCLDSLSRAGDVPGKELYSGGASTVLASLEADPDARIPMHSQVASSLLGGHGNKKGMEVPFSR